MVSESTPSGWAGGEGPGAQGSSQGNRQVSHYSLPPPLPSTPVLSQLMGKNTELVRLLGNFSILILFPRSTRPRASLFPKRSHSKTISSTSPPSQFFPDAHQDGRDWVSTHERFSQVPRKSTAPSSPTWHTGEGARWGCPLVTQQFLENAKSEAGYAPIC